MMHSSTPADWFEMTDLRRRRFATSVWVPLRVSETTVYSGSHARPGNKEETLAAGCIAVPLSMRAEAEKLGWSDIGLMNSGGPYAFEDGRYKTSDVYQYRDGEDFAVNLVIDQSFDGARPRIWHVNQDLILALGVAQEGDVWVKPEEGFVEVMRQRRGPNGDVVAIEIKSEFLRDYLAARGMALRLYYYRRRMEVMPDASHIVWTEQGGGEKNPHDRFETRMWAVDGEGRAYGVGVALFEVWRTDVDNEEDVPTFGPETAGNTASRSAHFTREGEKFQRVEGELWRAEWIEPASRSERVRGDEPEHYLTYVIDAAGKRETGDKLDNEEIGLYLWFDPRVIEALSNRRGGGLEWYTAQTGAVWCSPNCCVHFGINNMGLINTYAWDVARLPMWQQRIWAGLNITPNGPPSTELLDAQMRTTPARTIAPEKALPQVMEMLDEAIEARVGAKLFKSHEADRDILRSIHRFRALDDHGLLSLAKDIARLVADRIDIAALRKIVGPPKGENWGSLKSLEKALATVLTDEQARTMMAPLFGIYELRLADAHLPSSEIDAAFVKVGVDRSAIRAVQGQQLIASTVTALLSARDALKMDCSKRQD
jgi:hypothetical protein